MTKGRNKTIAVAAAQIAIQAQLLTGLARSEKAVCKGEEIVLIRGEGLLCTANVLREIASDLLNLIDDDAEGESK